MKYKVWECKIVVAEDAELPKGFDAPPRRSAMAAVEAAGIDVIACFSGWGGKVDKIEKQIIEDRKE